MADEVQVDKILRSSKFRVDYPDGSDEVVRVSGGGVSFQVEDSTPGNRKGNLKEFACGKPRYDDITLERLYVQGRNDWKDMVTAFQTGQRAVDPTQAGTVFYCNADDSDARSYTFYGYFPKSYDTIHLDSRNPDNAKEILTLEVNRVEWK